MTWMERQKVGRCPVCGLSTRSDDVKCPLCGYQSSEQSTREEET